jgi:hypothetical protein
MAGINVNWNIINVVDDNLLTKTVDETVKSVGKISKVDGGTTGVATDGLSAVGHTDATGLSTITITSDKTGQTATVAVADYVGNPFPAQLFDHLTFNGDTHHLDWDAQPVDFAFQLKTWIPHTLPVTTSPLSLASIKDNTGEDEIATLTLVDVFGNPIPGYQVEWTIQGVGIIKNAQSVTGLDGKATATIYSSEPGQSIVETKVLDKSGLPAYVYTATKQWYQVDDVEFTAASAFAINPTTGLPILGTPVSNVVNNPHTFTVQVSGLKYVWTSTDINVDGVANDEALVISRASAFADLGTIINEDGSLGATKFANQDLPVQTVMRINVGTVQLPSYIYVTRFADEALLAGEYWANIFDAPVAVPANSAAGTQLVWSTLAGKGVDFSTTSAIPTRTRSFLTRCPTPRSRLCCLAPLKPSTALRSPATALPACLSSWVR